MKLKCNCCYKVKPVESFVGGKWLCCCGDCIKKISDRFNTEPVNVMQFVKKKNAERFLLERQISEALIFCNAVLEGYNFYYRGDYENFGEYFKP